MRPGSPLTDPRRRIELAEYADRPARSPWLVALVVAAYIVVVALVAGAILDALTEAPR
jgi:hypothetical protein